MPKPERCPDCGAPTVEGAWWETWCTACPWPFEPHEMIDEDEV